MELNDAELRTVLEIFDLAVSEYGIGDKALALAQRIAAQVGEEEQYLYWLDHRKWWRREQARDLARDIKEARKTPEQKAREKQDRADRYAALSPTAKAFCAAAAACSRPSFGMK